MAGGPCRAPLLRVCGTEEGGAGGGCAAGAPGLMDEAPERRSLVVRLMRDEHWSPEEISGRISEERPDLAVSDSAIYRAVESGSLDCELPGHRKAARLLRHHGKLQAQEGKPGAQGRGAHNP